MRSTRIGRLETHACKQAGIKLVVAEGALRAFRDRPDRAADRGCS
jgi:hypothetical protein